jgi:hypothetical protein
VTQSEYEIEARVNTDSHDIVAQILNNIDTVRDDPAKMRENY